MTYSSKTRRKAFIEVNGSNRKVLSVVAKQVEVIIPNGIRTYNTNHTDGDVNMVHRVLKFVELKPITEFFMLSKGVDGLYDLMKLSNTGQED